MSGLEHLTPLHEAGPLERNLESAIFLGRWLLAPFYVGLLVAIALLLAQFFHELFRAISMIFTLTEAQTILIVLSLVDMALIANLLLMVSFIGYDHFVSRLGSDDKNDNPSWLRSTDYHGLKLKALGSIAVISAIQIAARVHRRRAFFGSRNYMGIGNPGCRIGVRCIARLDGQNRTSEYRPGPRAHRLIHQLVRGAHWWHISVRRTTDRPIGVH